MEEASPKLGKTRETGSQNRPQGARLGPCFQILGELDGLFDDISLVVHEKRGPTTSSAHPSAVAGSADHHECFIDTLSAEPEEGETARKKERGGRGGKP